MVKTFLLVCVMALLMISPGSLAAQEARQGEVKGRVADTTGNPVSGMKVIARNTTTGTEHEATTDQNGEFLISGLLPGRYSLQSQSGQSVQSAQSAQSGQPGQAAPSGQSGQCCPAADPSQIRVDGAAKSSVSLQQAANGYLEVRAETQIEDRSTASVRTVFGDLAIELLPQPNAINRNGKYFGAYNLALLSEAISNAPSSHTGVDLSVVGLPNTSNSFHVNGIDNNNHARPGPLVTVTNEATTDFSLTNGLQTQELGHVAGGQVNIIVVDASNRWHGGVYDYFNNRKLNAVEPALRGQRNLRYDQNRFGGKAGGALVRNTLFAFADFEYIPLRTEQVLLNSPLAPTAAGLAAAATVPGVSFTNLAVLRNNLAVSQIPVTTTTVGGVTIPLGVVNSGVRVRQNQYNGIANINWNMGTKSALSFRYVHNDLGTDAFGPALSSFRVPGHSLSLLGMVNYTATVSPSLTFNANGGYNRFAESVGGGDFSFPGLAAFPNITIQGLNLGLGPNTSVGSTRANTYHASGFADWRTGANNFRFGMDARWLQSVSGNFGSAVGNFTFSSLDRYLRDLPPDVSGMRSFGGSSFIGNRMLLHPFIQDTFRLGATDVELGLAYEYSTVPESLKRQSQLAGISVPGLIVFSEPQRDSWTLEPRVGLAWSPSSNSHTVVRAGFGIMYDALFLSNSMVSPEMTVSTVTSASNTPGFFAGGALPFAPIGAAAGVDTIAFDQELPYTVNWNAAVSHGFSGRLGIEFKYLGNHGVNLPRQAFLNQSPTVRATNSLPVFFTNPGFLTVNGLTTTQAGLASTPNAFTLSGFTNPILTTQPDGNSWYNAGVFKITQTFSAGTQIAAQYTYQDARTNATATPLDLAFARNMEQAPWNQKNRVTITPIVDIAAMLPQSSGALRNIFANFSLMATLTYATAPRIPLFSGIDTSMDGSGLGTGVFVNPNGIGGLGTGVTPLTNVFGDTVAFVANDPNARFVTGAPGTFSTERPTMKLGETRNIDLSVVKRFTFPDRAKIELRADAYNLINHPQFTGTTISTLGTGFGLTPSFLLADNPQFNNFRGTLSGNPRTLQLALRLIF